MTVAAFARVRRILDLEVLDDNLFRGQSEPMGGVNVFGGQVLAQSLIAAYQTVDADRTAHSLHSYFLRPGNMTLPIIFDVTNLRDGRSFNTRHITARQKGEVIFAMTASFQCYEKGLEYNTKMPDVPAPEGLISEYEWRLENAHLVPEKMRPGFTRERPMDVRPVMPSEPRPLRNEPMEPYTQSWIRAHGKIEPNETWLHQALIAFASDMGLLSTATRPHGVNWMQGNFQGASLDHCMWFHRPVRIDEWLLYVTKSTTTSNARGMNYGEFYHPEHGLVVSCTQEGLMRMREKKRK